MKTISTLALVIALAASACDTETPTTAIVVDAYPAIPDGGDATKEITVYKAWYQTSLFPSPAAAPGAESAPQRTVAANDFAYALLAPGWDPSSSTPPTRLIAVKSAGMIAVNRGDTLRIVVSDATFAGDCAAGKPLSQDDADFITQRIFPGDFANATYDARTCTTTPLPVDAGVTDAGPAD